MAPTFKLVILFHAKHKSYTYTNSFIFISLISTHKREIELRVKGGKMCVAHLQREYLEIRLYADISFGFCWG